MKILFIALALCVSHLAIAQDHENLEECSSHAHHYRTAAPINIMSNHIHDKGDFMFSYRFMNMSMGGNVSGTEDVSNADIFASSFMMAPQTMTMNMHMLGAMYGVSNNTTVGLMAMYNQNTMEMENMAGVVNEMESSGISDLKLRFNTNVLTENNFQLLLNYGINIPTGSIDEEAEMGPMNMLMTIGYPMQLGTGTWDLFYGATFMNKFEFLDMGLQFNYTDRLETNDAGYALGDQAAFNFWLGKTIADKHSISLFTEGKYIAEIRNMDDRLNMMMTTLNVATSQGGKFWNAGLGYNYNLLENLEIGASFSLPIYQKWDGIHMKNKSSLSAGIKYNI